MKKFYLPILILALSFVLNSLSAQSTIKGNISDENGKKLAFASVFVKETGQGAIANIDGYYELRLSPGKYSISFQYLGYESAIESINIQKGILDLSVVLKPRAIQLSDVSVKSNAEDPAVTVMRKAIAKAAYHRNQLNTYETTVYIKGSGRLKKAPFFLRKTIEKEGIDSTTAFTSESVSLIQFKRPNTYKERVISVYTNGSDNGMSPNSYFEGSFYDDKMDGSISPLSRKAFAYYKFKLESYYNENGFNINKIKVTPRSKGEDVFEGYIYILEDYWSIHSLSLVSFSNGFTSKINQLYAPIQDNVWMPVSFQLNISGKIMGFAFEYLYLATANDYIIEINPDLDVDFVVIDEKINKEITSKISKQKGVKNAAIHEKLAIGEELTRKDLRKIMRQYAKEERKKQTEPTVVSTKEYKIDSLAYKKDSSYWAIVRPIPLTKYEVKGYALSDSLSKVEKKKTTDKTEGKSSNEFSLGNILTGYHFKTGKRSSLAYSSPIIGIRFNPVEGFSVHETFTFKKRGEERKQQQFIANVTPRYAFARKKMTGIASLSYTIGKKYKGQTGMSFSLGDDGGASSSRYFKPNKTWQFQLSGGRYIFQYNEEEAIDELVSMFENLFRERNYIRLYEKDFVKYAMFRKIEKWKFALTFEWAKRYTLQNNTHQTWIKYNDKSYASNIPEHANLELPLNKAESAAIISFSVEGRPWQKYKRYNGKRRAISNTSPLLRFDIKNASPIEALSATARFTQLDLTVSHHFKIGVRSTINFKLNAGIFVSNKEMAFTDFKHFSTGNQLLYAKLDPVGNFRLLKYYRHSTNDKYLSTSVHYGFRKFLITQIPAVWMLGMKENLFVNYLATPTSQNHVELGYSLDKIFRFFRVEAVASFQNGKYEDFGVLIGISTGIGSMLNVE